MEYKKKKKLPMYEETFEKRRRLSNLHKNLCDRKKQYKCKSQFSAPVVIASTSKTSRGVIKTAAVDQEDIFDYDSDDSVKDKNYEPEEDDDSSDNERTYLKPSNHRKIQVKRQIFSPEKCITNTDTCENSELMTVEDLLGPQKIFDVRTDHCPDLDDCLSPPPKKICLEKTIVHVNEIGYMSENSNTPPSKLTPITSPTKKYSTAIVCKINKRVMTRDQPYSAMPITYGIMSVNSNGIIYLPDHIDECLTPPPKRLCLDKIIAHINEAGYLSEDSDAPLSKLTPVTSPKKYYSTTTMMNYYKTKVTRGLSNSPISISYGVMSIDTSGIIYLPNINNTNNIRETEENREQHVQDISENREHRVQDISGNENGEHHVQDISGTEKVRKKIVDRTKWKRIASKIARLKGSPYHSTVAKKKPDVEGRELKPPCSCKLKCYTKISQEKRLMIFNQFWKTCRSWDQRRQFVINNVKKEVKQNMKTDGNLETDRRKFTYKYKLSADYLEVNVCKVMFLNTLSIGEKFVKVSIEKQLEGGLTVGDQRGKHVPGNKSPEPMIKKVMEHIGSYPSYESHYSREKTEKKYLGPDLNILLMYKHYKELMVTERTPQNLIAKEWLYRNIFNTKFNLSFKLPSLDTCDSCDSYERKLRDAMDDTEKQEIEEKREEHRRKAEERYNLKKEDKNEALKSSGKKKVLMFDLQKCLATPNLTNTQSFYLRKLWTLNLTIYDATNNVASNMIWSENISGRGGNEVASCLIRWAEENKSKIAEVEELTFWSDNCAGQNRNLMIVMAYIWLLHKFHHLKVINHKFMMKGHTHMEVDHIHSQIEKKKKQLKTMQIATPRDWSQFIRTCGKKLEVIDMGLQDFKDLTTLYKRSGPLVARKKDKDGKEFKISECVWLQLKQEQPGVLFYKNIFSEDFSKISLVRNHPSRKDMKFPEDLPVLRREEKAISSAKYKDLITLLQWVPAELHSYYKNLKHNSNAPDFPETD